MPEGDYTTQELIDEIDDAIAAKGLDDEGLVFEYTAKNTCNFNIEGGSKIEDISGGLSKLLFDNSEGCGVGMLIGTTVFPDEDSRLPISSQNNFMSFTIIHDDNTTTTKNITIPTNAAGYTRSQLIDMLNAALSDTSVTASAYKSGIKLGSNDSIITGFKGNMFKLDTTDPKYTSVFYDNVKYGYISLTNAYVQGGTVLSSNSKDPEHTKYVINSANNELTFTANGATTPVTITIPDGEYTADQMASKLNSLFSANGLNLTASRINSNYSGEIEGYFSGIRIDSKEKGYTSDVGLDTTSSAYNTLFVNKEYNVFYKPYLYNASGDSFATVVGSKNFTTSKGNLPFTITSGVNDKFEIKINGGSYKEVTVPAGTYSTADSLASAINSAFNAAGADSEYAGKINVTTNGGGQLIVRNNEATGIQNINVRAVTGNNGYEDLFVTVTSQPAELNVTGVGQDVTGAKCNTVIPESYTFTEPSTLVVTRSGYSTAGSMSYTFAPGTYTKAEMIAKLNDAFKDRVTENNFGTKTYTGSQNVNEPTTVIGNTSETINYYNATGTTTYKEGAAGVYDKNTPAKVSIQKKLSDSVTVDSTNNTLKISINGNGPETITLDSKTYTAEELKNALQSKIDAKFGTKFGGATVSIESGKLTFTARLNKADGKTEAGSLSNITIDSSNSSLIKYLDANRTAGTARSAQTLNNSSTINSSNNTFSVQYTENGVAKNASVSLTAGNYNTTMLINEINKQFKNNGINLTASIESNRLKLSTNSVGSGNSVTFSPTANDEFSKAVFSDYKLSAKGNIGGGIQSSITIDNTSNVFNINVDGNDYSVILPNGTYSATSFATKLNETLRNAGVPVSVSYNYGALNYTTDSVGNTASVSQTYSTGGSSMKAIYGTSTAYGMTASVSADGKLSLSGNVPYVLASGSYKIIVNAATGSIFETGDKISKTGPSTYGVSSFKSYVESNSKVTVPLVIDKSNSDMSFTYVDNNVGKSVSISVPQKTYSTLEELKTTLQGLLDAKVGTDELEVSINSGKLRINTVTPGSSYRVSNFSGGFYDRVLGRADLKSQSAQVTTHKGEQANDTAYTVGRKNIRNGAEIIYGINDTLSLDFTVNGKKTQFTFTLDPGKYTGGEIVTAIQNKLNEQLKAKGYSENLIEVQIGGVNTGVIGADDENALVFKLSQTTKLPNDEQGEYIIDGISGSAAFTVFYQTDGEMTVAYSKGAKDLSDGVTIDPSETELKFKYDNNEVTLNIPAGDYTGQEMVNLINGQLTTSGYPLLCELDEGNLRVYVTKFGQHSIGGFGGSAVEKLFYSVNGEDETEEEIPIQFSNITDDRMTIEKRRMGTAYLGINSITLSRVKYAKKANERIDEALTKVSEARSYFGATQNRLESSIRNNENKEENLTAAESRIRDADISNEVVNLAKSNILEQVTASILAQANSSPEQVLSLINQ